jgi:protein-S-isoprenylcysteine O-methyltransferase Ste14
MPELVYRIAAIVLFVPYMAVRAYWRRRTWERMHTAPRVSRAEKREKITLAVLGLFSIPMFLWFFSPFVDFAHVAVPDWARWTGAAVYAIGVYYFWRVHQALAMNWSPLLEVRDGATLVTSGPYRLVRHPMYSSAQVLNIGLALLSANWLVAVTMIGSMYLLYALRVRDEEQLMIDAFGDEYRAYMGRTGRLVPRPRALFGRP